MTVTKKTKQKSNYVSKFRADKMRAKLNYLIDEKAVRSSYIADKSGVFSDTIHKFRKGKKTITEKTADKLDEVLKEYKF